MSQSVGGEPVCSMGCHPRHAQRLYHVSPWQCRSTGFGYLQLETHPFGIGPQTSRPRTNDVPGKALASECRPFSMGGKQPDTVGMQNVITSITSLDKIHSHAMPSMILFGSGKILESRHAISRSPFGETPLENSLEGNRVFRDT
jgi:hypothetical protein